MSTAFTPQGIWPTTHLEMDGNDAPTPFNMNRLPRDNADGLEYLKDRLLPGGTDIYPVPMVSPVTQGAGFMQSTTEPGLVWEDSFDSGSVIEFWAPVPLTGTIVEAMVTSKGNGHTSAIAIEFPPRIRLFRQEPTVGVPVEVGYGIANPLTIANDTICTWGDSLIAESIQPGRFYIVRVQGEHGAAAKPNHLYYNIHLGVVPA